MEELYAKVQFSFGTYTFCTYDNSLAVGDMVMCLVKTKPSVGEFKGYCSNNFDGFVKPLYGRIEPIIHEFERKQKVFMEQEKIKSPVPEIYDPHGTYVCGDHVILDGAVWKADDQLEFLLVCSLEEWNKIHA